VPAENPPEGMIGPGGRRRRKGACGAWPVRNTPFTVEVEKRSARSFAEAIGDQDPLFRDEGVARAAGYASIPAPPTFAFLIGDRRGIWT
jgi:hypothetical protein